ncbi:uncharacterized protein LOC143302086 [Babylonia areolata]|uniref:uncharacterized protein LOC143302086 n=1 Tax=Babylonia areolata TaxID=304850 RepID=UPI003FD3E67B
MDSQSGTVHEHGLLRQSDGGGVDGSTGGVDLGVAPSFSLSALGTSSGLAVEGEPSNMHVGTTQNLSVLQPAPSVSVTELMNVLPATTGLTLTGGSTIQQWGGLGSQNAIITFHTVPFVEGGQEIAITETCMPVNVDLGSAEHANLVQSLISQGVSMKPEDADKSSSVDASQLIDLSTATVTGELVGQELSAVSSQLTSADIVDSKAGTSDIAPVVIASSVPEVSAPIVFTDETPIFTRVCTTLNADIMNCVPGSREALVDELNREESAQLGIDDQQHFTVEASLATISRVHNRLKDLLNLPSPTHLKLSSEPPALPTKKVDERGVSCRLLLPFVSSKGRRVKLPSYLPAVMNDNDAFDSDDSDYDVKAPRNRRKGRPRKLVDSSSPQLMKTRQASNHTELNGDSVTDVVSQRDEEGTKDEDSNAKEETGESSAARKFDNEENAENILDSSERPGVMRTARAFTHVSQATRKRRIYEGRIKFKFFCDKCSFKSKRESHYNKHMKLHEGASVEVHKCTECDFKTIRLSHLRRHELLHKNSNSLLTCNLCGYLTDSANMLSKHVKLKHPNGRNSTASQQQFNCEVCGHSSSNRKYFTRHLMRHARDSNNATVAGPDGFQCTECSKTFQRRVHYDRHLRDVHGPQLRPHLCDICGKSFKRSDALQQHKVVHTSQANRKYQFHCAKCSKGFRSQAHLREHLTMHSSERPFLCHYCGSSFKTQSVQRKHILSLHVKPRSHSCSLCTKKFNTPYALRRHNRTHEIEAQKLAATSAQNTSAVQETTLIQLGMDTEEATHLGQVSTDAAVVAVADTGDGLQVQQQALVQDVMAAGMEESIEGDALPAQYIVQGSETASALFYLTSSL